MHFHFLSRTKIFFYTNIMGVLFLLASVAPPISEDGVM